MNMNVHLHDFRGAKLECSFDLWSVAVITDPLMSIQQQKDIIFPDRTGKKSVCLKVSV